jgi:hypothetical protein
MSRVRHPVLIGLRHRSHNPAKAKGSLAFEMNLGGDFALSLFAPPIEPVTGNNTAAALYEKPERR